MEWEQPEEFNAGGDFLSEPGTYHFAVNDITEENDDGTLIDGFRVTLAVLDGTVRNKSGCTEVDKQTSLILFNGKMSSKDGGRFARQKQAAFFVAAGVIGEAEVELLKQKKLNGVDLEKARGAQIVATMSKRPSGRDDGKSYLDFNYSDIWHIDDEKAKPFPKSAEALSLLPANRRSTPERLQAIKDAFGGGKKSDAKPQPAAAGVGADDLDI